MGKSLEVGHDPVTAYVVTLLSPHLRSYTFGVESCKCTLKCFCWKKQENTK